MTLQVEITHNGLLDTVLDHKVNAAVFISLKLNPSMVGTSTMGIRHQAISCHLNMQNKSFPSKCNTGKSSEKRRDTEHISESGLSPGPWRQFKLLEAMIVWCVSSRAPPASVAEKPV